MAHRLSDDSFRCPPAVNLHLLRACNADCSFCFATFRQTPGWQDPDDLCRVLGMLREAGVEKVNFAGGEPTLHPHIGRYLRHARELGFTVSLVSNGFRMHDHLDRHAADIDWVGLSIDAPSDDTLRALGRGGEGFVESIVSVADRCHQLGIRLKVNTVVTALTVDDDLRPLIRRLRPERWKVFQVLRVEGQNDGRVEPLLISSEQFARFVARHGDLAAEGFAPVVEDNVAMIDSYAMIDPAGRFYGDHGGVHVESRPILEVGVVEALRQVHFDAHAFEARGGVYAW